MSLKLYWKRQDLKKFHCGPLHERVSYAGYGSMVTISRQFRLAILFSFCAVTALAAQEPVWKAGIAKTAITPEQPVWMAGYSGRKMPATTALHDLWIKALVLEDGRGHRGILLTSDLAGLSRTIYENVLKELHRRYGLDRSQVVFPTSHTHCGPLLLDFEVEVYPLNEERLAAVERYTSILEAKMVATIGEALSHLAPVRLTKGQGTASFAVNRRNNVEGQVPELLESGTALNGPVDHSVPVLAVRSVASDQLLAIVFTYACHNTTLSINRWCGDYAGFAQIALERQHPAAVAMFTMGCGGDQNPLPRRKIELCEKYGTLLAAAVDTVLENTMEPVEPWLGTSFTEIQLKFNQLDSREDLQAYVGNRLLGLKQKLAVRYLQLLDNDRQELIGYPYPIHVWKLGHKQLWILLAGEAVVDYSLRFKHEIDPNVWVTAYVNDVMEYIPSARVLREGNYEGTFSYNLPADRWADDIEDRIVDGVNRLVKEVNLN